MLQFNMPRLLELSKELGRLRQVYASWNNDDVLDIETQSTNSEGFKRHSQHLHDLDLKMCGIYAVKISENMGKSPKLLVPMMDQLQERMEDECSLRKFMALSTQDAAYVFPDGPLFGAEVEQKYPSAAFEIDEAGKCFGLSRPTAAVFHLMRTMEVAINATGACLNIPPPVKDAERNWGRILEKIKAELDRRNAPNQKLWATPADRTFFAEAYASLDAVRVAWRNTTMHVENKYSPDEAEHIFGSVRGFMRKLASRCDESGDPKA
jgi:hypothetical protein